MQTSNKGLFPAISVLTVLMCGPLFTIFAFSLMASGDYGGVVKAFSLQGYIDFFYTTDFDDNLVFDPGYLWVFGRSVGLSLASVVICVLVGFPTVYYIAMQSPKTRLTLMLVVTIPFWTNLLVRTISWIGVLRENGVINEALLWIGIIDQPISILYTQGAILLGIVYSYIPFFILPVYAALEKLDSEVIEAARDLYADQWRSLWYVTIPMVKSAIATGCLLVFIPGIGAFIAPDLLGGSKQIMVGNLIKLQFTSSRNWPLGSAMAVIVMSVILIFFMLQARRVSLQREGAHV